MEAYLDNAAATAVLEPIRQQMEVVFQEEYGNPSSKHIKGLQAEKRVNEAKKTIAATLKCEPKEIVFTSGGTESNNQALIGTAYANGRRGRHIITTQIEHASVHEPLGFLEEQGFEVTYLPVDYNGLVREEDLVGAIKDETILISMIYVNNEIGSVQPLEQLIRAAKAKKSDVTVHVDAIQAYGKYRIYPKRIGVDLLSVSGHKIHGPKGAGFLYIGEKTKTRPIIFGGGQQKGMRSGTENVPGIVGTAEAAKFMYDNLDRHVKRLYRLKKFFMEQLQKEADGVIINGMEGLEPEQTAPHIVSVSFEGIRSEVLLHALAEEGIYVSSGSACSSNHPELSGTLRAIGVQGDLLDATLRFSFSVMTTEEELAYTVQVIQKQLPVLRRYTRG